LLKKRIITACVGVPFLAIIIWLGEPWFGIMLAIWGVLAAYEFFHLVSSTRIQPLTYFGLVFVAIFILRSHIEDFANVHLNFDAVTPFLVTAVIILSLIWLLLLKRKENAFVSWAWTVGGIFYLGWLLGYYVSLRQHADGRNWVFLALSCTFICDTFAYFFGRKWGKNHLAPNVSPNKTWEGAAAGVGGAILASLFFILPTPLHLPMVYWQAILLGILVSFFGQTGDLVKSLFKRNMGVKDSGRMLPGHGGFLDRIDSVVFTGVVVFYYAIWMFPAK
jgi:phosphatidate cytidylyltransferase